MARWHQPPLPAIEQAPAALRAHGLREAHAAPRVSKGKNEAGQWQAVERRPAATAWTWPEIELNTPNSRPVLLLDIDRGTALEDIAGLASDGLIPWPNWTAMRAGNGHLHAAYCLAKPVLTGPKARRHPLKHAARCSEWMAETLNADQTYRSVLTHNPAAGQWMTSWHRKRPYTLAEIADYIPRGWRQAPAQRQAPRTAFGRNCLLFEAACSWAGRQENETAAVLDYLQPLNAGLNPPVGYLELRGIARSVERYRDEWKAAGWHRPAWITRQSHRGKRSGQARRIRTADRTRTAVDLYGQGHSQRVIAATLNMSRGAVKHTLQRENARKPDPKPDQPQHARKRTETAVRTMHGHGISQTKIAAALDISRRQVKRILQQAPDPLKKGPDRVDHEPTQDDPESAAHPAPSPRSDSLNVCMSDSQDPNQIRTTGPAAERGRGLQGETPQNPPDPDMAALARAAETHRKRVEVTTA